jgi:hypothetical protein
LNPKKGRRKKPQRGSATRVTPRESNFQSAEKPQGSRNCGGGKADRKVERGTRSQIPQRESEGQEREPRQSAGETEQGQGAEQPGESSEAGPNLRTETSSKETMSKGSG